ncbi:nuclear transport factor 2 family protein [Cupriavidus sp. AcVe19-1a]|uniref:nuclear transport factor 2 family protein n=1 Tax=Cupriavidus sp. AcVe19-1a TaxID=2821359 RepID=UPI001AE1DED9|nr:nuclear transport factor 2 family protein [Cupriavidus sp. AcVe19-1a]MBP0630517.1 nuclear transport factor 2 family protein [Cupriavidus sp. AcVe19-1a]
MQTATENDVMHVSDHYESVIACQQSVLLFYYALDRGEYPLAMAQVAPDCQWERGGAMLRGRQQIEDSLRNRPVTQVARHTVQNFAVLRGEAQRATAVYSLCVHLYDDGSPASLPVPGSTPFLLADVTCELGLEADNAWRIRRLDIQRIFSYSREVIHPLAAPKQG